MVPIRECAEIINGFAFKSELFTKSRKKGVLVVRIRDVVRGKSETFYSGDFPKNAVVNNGDLLIGMDGEFNIARWRGGMAVLNQRVCKIIPKDEIADLGYLHHALKAVLERIEERTPFVTVKHLSSEDLKDEVIPLPSLPEQRRIAARLEQADRLLLTCRYALELSDGFISAAFLERFGDPRQNPFNWPLERLGSTCSKFSDGPFGSNLKSEHYKATGVRVVRLQNIGVGEFIDDDKAFISSEHFQTLRKHECLPGDVLIGTLGDPNLRASILPSYIPIALNKADCVQARPNPKKATAEYIATLLNIPSTLHLIPGMIHGQTRARVSMGELAELPIPLPPLSLQLEFASFTASFDRLYSIQREALRQADHLFQSLLQEAFSTEAYKSQAQPKACYASA